jgi:membrane-associated protein
MALDIPAIVSLLERYGYLIVFFAAVAEALPLLGVLVPGQAIVLLAGALSATDHLSLWLVMLAAFPAGILGDAVGYYIGRRYGRGILERYGRLVRIEARHLERSDAMFRKWGPWALIFGRFSFLTRGLVPLLAGVSRIRQRVFWPVNIAGALAWAVGYSVLGYFFGAAWLRLEGLLGRILAITLLAVLGLVLLYRILKRYADQFTRDDLWVAFLGVLGGTVFGILADRIEKLGHANALDRAQPALVDLLAPLRPALEVLEPLANYALIGMSTLGLMAFLAWKRRTWEATLCGMGVGGIILLVEILRPVFARAFEPNVVGGTFPGSNGALAVVFAGVITYLVASHARRRWVVWLTIVLGGVFAWATGIAPVALAHEQPTDFLAGLSLGVAWLSVSILVVEFGLKRTPSDKETPTAR